MAHLVDATVFMPTGQHSVGDATRADSHPSTANVGLLDLTFSMFSGLFFSSSSSSDALHPSFSNSGATSEPPQQLQPFVAPGSSHHPMDLFSSPVPTPRASCDSIFSPASAFDCRQSFESGVSLDLLTRPSFDVTMRGPSLDFLSRPSLDFTPRASVNSLNARPSLDFGTPRGSMDLDRPMASSPLLLAAPRAPFIPSLDISLASHFPTLRHQTLPSSLRLQNPLLATGDLRPPSSPTSPASPHHPLIVPSQSYAQIPISPLAPTPLHNSPDATTDFGTSSIAKSGPRVTGHSSSATPLSPSLSASASDDCGAARKRTRLSAAQREYLLDQYERDNKPTTRDLREIAAVVGTSLRHVQFWFQNRRAAARRRDAFFESVRYQMGEGTGEEEAEE
ncbi:hypothetical protein BC830DRAFT_1127498 [Chytriomyces sp. MP71]|nr:hypothetical protein BC830DRAFT_1127498 [Chytriomyces sp. MP71]